MTFTNKNLHREWLNPAMLAWARGWRGLSVEDVANKFDKSPDKILAWENNEAAPTIIQARKLASIYQRPFMEFFLRQPPVLPGPKVISDFRLHKDILDASGDREVPLIIQWAEAQRSSALDLYAELGEIPPEFPTTLFFTERISPESAAKKARKAVSFTAAEQTSLRKNKAYTLPTIIRHKLERIGTLTLRNTHLKEHGIRGFCIAEFPLPVVVVGNEAPTAQAFTIMHEFGHLLLKQSGISGPRNKDYEQIPEEKWCDHFAAAFLMPKDIIVNEYSQVPSKPFHNINDNDLEVLANKFKVSPHAMLIRLVHLKYIESSYYWNIKKVEFDEQDRNYKSFGRPLYYGKRYRSQLGDLYTGLVVEAWSAGRITNHNAAEYMGIKNMQHLYDIRKEFTAR